MICEWWSPPAGVAGLLAADACAPTKGVWRGRASTALQEMRGVALLAASPSGSFSGQRQRESAQVVQLAEAPEPENSHVGSREFTHRSSHCHLCAELTSVQHLSGLRASDDKQFPRGIRGLRQASFCQCRIMSSLSGCDSFPRSFPVSLAPPRLPTFPYLCLIRSHPHNTSLSSPARYPRSVQPGLLPRPFTPSSNPAQDTLFTLVAPLSSLPPFVP